MPRRLPPDPPGFPEAPEGVATATVGSPELTGVTAVPVRPRPPARPPACPWPADPVRTAALRRPLDLPAARPPLPPRPAPGAPPVLWAERTPMAAVAPAAGTATAA